MGSTDSIIGSIASKMSGWDDESRSLYTNIFIIVITSAGTYTFADRKRFCCVSFGLLAIVGLYKVTRIILNKEIAKISALILFFIPFFFGHLAINSKDTILAFSHVWIIYYLLKYINKSNDLNRRIYTILKLSVL